MKNKINFFIIVVFFLTFTKLVFADSSGFIPGQIWYSTSSMEVGDNVDIHTAVWNGESNTVSFKIEFYDHSVILGTKSISVKTKELKDISVPWKITAGNHLISAKIILSQINVNGKNEDILLDNNTTITDKKNILVKIPSNNSILDGDNKITNVLSTEISNSYVSIEDFRKNNLSKILDTKNKAKEEIEILNSSNKNSNSLSNDKIDISLSDSKIDGDKKIDTNIQSNKIEKTNNTIDGTQKPIAYIRLFLFSFLVFVFSSQVVFYLVLCLLVFYIIRFIYRKIHNR